MKPIQVAIVGCGRISDLHQMGYRGREDARITAVCDTNKAACPQESQRMGRGQGLHGLPPDVGG